MSKDRLEAFSDGVLAILITIMVLDLRTPAGSDFAALSEVLPQAGIYLLSFVFLGIYWNNHHHLLHATAIPLSLVNRWAAIALFILVALMWLVPDPRIESRVSSPPPSSPSGG